MDLHEKITGKISANNHRLTRLKSESRALTESTYKLSAYRDLKTTGLKFGDRFRIMGNHYRQVNPEGVLIGQRKGLLVGRIISVTGALSNLRLVFHPELLKDIIALGPDKERGTKYANELDITGLLEDGAEALPDDGLL